MTPGRTNLLLNSSLTKFAKTPIFSLMFKIHLLTISFAIILFLIFTPQVLAAGLVINEFVSDTAGTAADPDWVEMYNSGSESVDLSKYRLRDNTVTNKLDLTGTIEPGGFAAFDWSNRLNKDGDLIKLVEIVNESNQIDQVAYGNETGGEVGAPESGQSTGRQTDGAATWVIFLSPTKASNNRGAIVVPTPSPTPTPTPVPTPSPTLSPTPSPKSSPSPSPTPQKSPTLKPKPSPTPSSAESPQVLGQTDQSSPAPSPDQKQQDQNNQQQNQSPSRIKIAGTLAGSGATLIGASFGFYLWYKRILGQKTDEEKS
ncbi:lamin tail domain-containing protein [Candidatus Curtissbacteria bacterium]|nr:lamin tail domain-containing protein [Candidatus Curtissbacteria bacterium]